MDKDNQQSKAGFWQRLNAGDRKLMLRICGLIIIGITLIYGSGFFSEEQSPLPTGEVEAVNSQLMADEEMEAKLERIISAIEGVGTVEVALSYAQSASYEYAVNTETSLSTNDDQDEGNQSVSNANQSNESISLAEINAQPVLLKESMPILNGAVIVAAGAENSLICEKIYGAVQTLTGLPLNRIEILAAEN